MTIWRHEDDRITDTTVGKDAVVSLYMKVHHTRTCAYCHEALKVVVDHRPTSDALVRAHQRITAPDPILDSPTRVGATAKRAPFFNLHSPRPLELFEHQLRVCPVCGWWVHFKEFMNIDGDESEHQIHTQGGIAALKLLDLRDIRTPLDEVRAFLAAKYEQRFTMNPALFEQTVASVFETCGYRSRVVGRSGDDGIDVILDGDDGSTIGVQVKRYKDVIGVEEIRGLAGAMVVNRLTKGIFVTTSDFTAGVPRTVSMAADDGKAIELYNADRFYDALKLSQINDEAAFREFAEQLSRRPLTLIYTNSKPGRSTHDYQF